MPPLTREDSLFYTPPEAFGPFRVLHQIGAGVLGPVFRTHEAGGERLVTVKVFRLDITPEQARALADELGKLSSLGLRHPAIAAPIAAGMEGTVAYLAEEHVAGESLDVSLRQFGRAPLADMSRLIDVLADAIDFAASTGTNHGSLHPRDVIIAAGGGPRVTGFGVAPALERVGLRAPVRRPYSAPERTEGSAWGQAADVFALAAIVHELIFGRRIAANADQIVESLAAIDGADRAPLREVFATALASSPAGRYQSARGFAETLRRASARPEAVTMSSPSAVERRPTSPPGPPAPDRTPTLPLGSGEDAAPAEDAAADSPASFQIQRRHSVIDGSSTFASSAAWPARDAIEATDWTSEEQAAAREVSAPPRFQHVDEADANDGPLGAPLTLSGPVETLHDSLAAPDHPETLVHADTPAASRLSGTWPFAVTLAIGLLVGGIGGYELSFRTAAGRDQSQAAADAPHPSGGRDWTERAVQDSPPAVAPPVPAESTGPGAVRTPSPVSIGRLLVRSSPAGAQVTVNGDLRGLTPLALQEVPFGTHTVRLVRAGYQPQRRRVSISSERPSASIEVSLKPVQVIRSVPRPMSSSAPGALSVQSRPSGAIVFLDSRRVGTTPLELPKLTAGVHTLRIEHTGFRRWSSSVRIVGGGRARVTASLERGSQP